MPKVPIRPLLRWTKPQLKAWAERNLEKYSGKIAQGAERELFESGAQPPVAKEIGKLSLRNVEKGFEQGEFMPINRARDVFYEDKLKSIQQKVVPQYSAGKAGPVAQRLRLSEPGDPPESIIGPDIPRFGRRLAYEAEKPVQVDTQKAFADYLMTVPGAEIIVNDFHALRIWNMIGGHKSAGGLKFQSFLRKSRHRQHYENTQDYFTKQFLSWKKTPKQFKKNHEEEADFFEKIWEIYSAGMKEGRIK